MPDQKIYKLFMLIKINIFQIAAMHFYNEKIRIAVAMNALTEVFCPRALLCEVYLNKGSVLKCI